MTQQFIDIDHRFAHDVERRNPVPFKHNLADHPMLDLEQVAQLAESLGEQSITYEAALKPLIGDVQAPPRTQRAAEIIRSLDENGAWLTLLNIEANPNYHDFVDEVLDDTVARSGVNPTKWRRRSGFIFASSPGSVTPAHFDIEQSLIMQLRGNRTLSFGEFADEQSREEEVRRYWNGSFGRLATLPKPLADFPLSPGDGAYIPPYQPHWLQNEDATSLSLTLTFFTKSNESESHAQVFNQKMTKLGMNPRAYGTSAVRDRAKVGVVRAYSRLPRRSKTAPPATR